MSFLKIQGKAPADANAFQLVVANWPLLVETDLVDQLARLFAMRDDLRQRLVVNLQGAEGGNDVVECCALPDRIFEVGFGIDLLGFVRNKVFQKLA